MPRIARVVFPGAAHHVTQRGNRRADVLRADGYRRHYLVLFREAQAGRIPAAKAAGRPKTGKRPEWHEDKPQHVLKQGVDKDGLPRVE